MIETELFKYIARTGFSVYEVITEKEVEKMYKIYPRKDTLRDLIREKIAQKDIPIELPEKITVEIYLLLIEFCFKNKIDSFEVCALFKIISDVLALFRNNANKAEVYEKFKSSLLTFSMNRFSSQIGILKKETVYKITDFFIDVIYRRYSLLHFCLTNKDNITLETRQMSNYTLPSIEELSSADEILPRNAKILRQYFESRRPKTELEQKIEAVLEFEREKMDKKMGEIFEEQDKEFNVKVEELMNKKKK